MNLRQIVTLGAALLAAVSAFANSATLVTDKQSATAGTEVTMTASATFTVIPGAVGWSINLPEGWSYVATGGNSAPQITPQAGDTGTLEWAYTEAPASGASFSFKVKAAGSSGVVRVNAKVMIRVEGKLETVEVAPVVVSVTS